MFVKELGNGNTEDARITTGATLRPHSEYSFSLSVSVIFPESRPKVKNCLCGSWGEGTTATVECGI